MELGIEAARWMVGKALGPVSSGVLEAWAASNELGTNVEALRMELLYAEGMLNNARSHGRSGPGIKNPALSELLQKLRNLAYRADDVLDELDYFRIQDELDHTYHAAEEHDGGCLRNHALNARHTARAIAKMLGFSKCPACFANATHAESVEDIRSTKRVPPCGGHWPCTGIKASDDDEEEEEDDDKEEDEDPRQGGVCWPRPCGSGTDQLVNNGCMGRITSAARNTIHSVGKHFPCRSVSSIQNADSNSNIASTGRRFFCCARPNKAPQREIVLQTPKLKFYRVEMSQKIEDIVDQLKPLCAKVSTILNLELLAANLNNNGKYMATGRPITTSESFEPEIYGREDITSQLIHDITKGKYCHMDLTVLPIVGPGGIGKTTLTQHIYKKLQDHFEIKFWVCVSVNFNVSRLTQEIADKIKKDEKDSPKSRIEEGLKSKRFLLVLDDIWSCSNEDEWNRFLIPFKKGQTKGSVILVTTRFPAVAQIMVKTIDNWIDLKGINEKEFEKLFIAYVFGNNELTEDQSKLLDIGREIIKKLKGSPLAAKTVGRLLRNHLDSGHWTRVLKSREWESQSGDHDIMPALKLSFDYLPFHLQQCFAYCSLFPEDYKFSEEEIIHFWIGLDVLHSRGENKKVEDIGLSYLIELTNHGFFKKEKDDDGRTCFVIHDLMHELGLKVSADECLSLYSSNVRAIQILPTIRHLSINIDDSSFKDREAFDFCKEDFSVLGERLKVENLHSLLLFGKHQGSFAKTFHGLFSKAKALRVILISGDFYSMEDVLHNFSELIHLRYLRVHDSSMIYGQTNKLVASNNISRFYHMRVLDLRGCQDCHNLPRYMTNLSKLRHFLVEDDTMHSKILEVGKLKTLQELKRFEVEKGNKHFELIQIGHLIELCGSLSIDNLENVEGREGANEAKLIDKKNLNELTINWNVEQSNKDRAREEQVIEGLKPHSNLQKLNIRGHGGGTCPSWLGLNLSVQNLESLCLDGVDWETFPPIGGELQLVNKGIEKKLSNSPSQYLKNLKSIELANLERLERWVVDSSGQLLPHLEVLVIINCHELVEIVFSDCNYSQQDRKTWPPKLRRLVIQDCPKLLSLPPVPWNPNPCSIWISGVGLGFERLSCRKFYGPQVCLQITGNKDTQDSASFWSSLDFDNLTDIKKLTMTECPPLPLDGLQKMSSLKDVNISCCNDAFGPVKDGRHASYQFAVESMIIQSVGAISGKKLTQVLSYMPKLSKLTIEACDKITGLGVVGQQQEEAMASSCRRSREEEEIEEAEEEGLLLLPPQLHELSIESCPELRLGPLDSLVHGENEDEDRGGGLQALCRLRSLSIVECPKFLSSYAPSSSSSFPFPSSLQSLLLYDVQTLPPLSNLASLATLKIHGCGGDARCVGLGRLLAHGCLQHLTVLHNSTHFFDSDELSIPSSRSTLLPSLETNDVPGVLAAPVCRLLSSSLTKLVLHVKEERFTVEQDNALQLLTSLQHLDFYSCKKLQSLPSGLQRLTSLKTLEISFCPSIRSLPSDSLPNSLQNLAIYECSEIRSLDGLPNSLQNLTISDCSAIRSLDGLPNSLQNLTISDCSAIRSLDGLPNSLQNLTISDCSAIRSLDGLPNSLQNLTISDCSAIRSLDSLPNSLQELRIDGCPSFRSLPKGIPPTSLKLIDVRYSNSEELKRQCRKLIGTIPIVKAGLMKVTKCTFF